MGKNAAVLNDSYYTYGAATSSTAPTTPVNTMHTSIIKLFAILYFQFAGHTVSASKVNQPPVTTRL
jgi:hypothetical protein